MKDKIGKRSWVKRRGGLRGQVLGNRGNHEIRVRWVGQNRAEYCSLKGVKSCKPPIALLLEGWLDPQIHSTRSEANVLRGWLESHDVNLAYKPIHMLEDIDIIGKKIGRNRPVFVHISCHGYVGKGEPPPHRPSIYIAPNVPIYLRDKNTIDIFARNFGGLPVLFSACLIARYQDAMTEFKKSARLLQVAAFTRIVEDCEATLFDLLVYQGILGSRLSFNGAIDKANRAMREIGVRGGRGQGLELARVF